MEKILNIAKRAFIMYTSYSLMKLAFLVEWDGEILSNEFLQLFTIFIVSVYLFLISIIKKHQFDYFVKNLIDAIKE